MPDPGMNALLMQQAQANPWFPLMQHHMPAGLAWWMPDAGNPAPQNGQPHRPAQRRVRQQPRMSSSGLFPLGGAPRYGQATLPAGDPTVTPLHLFGDGPFSRQPVPIRRDPGSIPGPVAPYGLPAVAPGTGPLRPPGARYNGVPHVKILPETAPRAVQTQPFVGDLQVASGGQSSIDPLQALLNPTLVALHGIASTPQAPSAEQTTGISGQTRQHMLAQGYPDPWAPPLLGVRLDPHAAMAGWDSGQARTPGTLQFVMRQLDHDYAGDEWYLANRSKVKYRIQQDMAGYIQARQHYPARAGRDVIHDMLGEPSEERFSAAGAEGDEPDDSFPDLLLRAWGNVKDAYYSAVNQPSSSILTFGVDEKGRRLPPRTVSPAARNLAYQQIANAVPHAIEGVYRGLVDHPSGPMMTAGFDSQGRPLPPPPLRPYDPNNDPGLAPIRAGSQLVNVPGMAVAPELALQDPSGFVDGILDQARAPFDSSLSPEKRLEGGLNTAGLLYGLWKGGAGLPESAFTGSESPVPLRGGSDAWSVHGVPAGTKSFATSDQQLSAALRGLAGKVSANPILDPEVWRHVLTVGRWAIERGASGQETFARVLRQSGLNLSEAQILQAWKQLSAGQAQSSLSGSTGGPVRRLADPSRVLAEVGDAPLRLSFAHSDLADSGTYLNPNTGAGFESGGGPSYAMSGPLYQKSSWTVSGPASAQRILRRAEASGGWFATIAAQRDTVLGSHGRLAAAAEIRAALDRGTLHPNTVVYAYNRALQKSSVASGFARPASDLGDVLKSLDSNNHSFRSSVEFMKRFLSHENALELWDLPDYDRVIDLLQDPFVADARPGDLMSLFKLDRSQGVLDLASLGLPSHPVYRRPFAGENFGYLAPGVNVRELVPHLVQKYDNHYGKIWLALERQIHSAPVTPPLMDRLFAVPNSIK